MKFSLILIYFYLQLLAADPQLEFKPFEFLESARISSDQELHRLEPQIQVQSVLGEGIGWQKMHVMSQSPAFHVIVTVTGSDPNTGKVVPLIGQTLLIMTQKPMPCIIEQGNGGFDVCSFDGVQSQNFTTNSAGRTSFSIPIDGIQNLDDPLSPLFLQMALYMKSDEW